MGSVDFGTTLIRRCDRCPRSTWLTGGSLCQCCACTAFISDPLTCTSVGVRGAGAWAVVYNYTKTLIVVAAKREMRASMYRLLLRGRPYGYHTVFHRLRDRYQYADLIDEYEDILDRVLLFLLDDYDCRFELTPMCWVGQQSSQPIGRVAINSSHGPCGMGVAYY